MSYHNSSLCFNFSRINIYKKYRKVGPRFPVFSLFFRPLKTRVLSTLRRLFSRRVFSRLFGYYMLSRCSSPSFCNIIGVIQNMRFSLSAMLSFINRHREKRKGHETCPLIMCSFFMCIITTRNFSDDFSKKNSQ